MNRKFYPVTILILLFCFILRAWAEIPPGYYNQAEGTKAGMLKTTLHQIIKKANVLKYGGKGTGYTWQGFVQTDALEGDWVLDRYSGVERRFNGLSAVDGMNIEHSFANSWWGGINNQAYKDLHHLYPADGKANITKSNNPMGIVDRDGGYDNGVIKVGLSTCRDANNLIKVWEPSDDYKGDFARAYLYMATCYEDFSDLWRGDGLLMLDNNTYPVFEPWAVKLLLEWNAEDPVSELEENRNETVFQIQGNRNPFIDYPQLAEYIWGNRISTAFYTEADEANPVLFVPVNGSVIDFGLQALSIPAKKTFLIRGRNLTDNLTLSLSNDLYSLSKTALSPQEVTDGSEIEISCIPASEGLKDAVLTLSFDGKQETVIVKADFWDGIPAYPAENVVSSVYNKSFTASWMKMPDISSYALDVYTKNGEVAVSLPGFPRQVASNDTVIKVNKAETTYFYKVSGAGMTSNEVEVIMPAIPPVFSVKNTNLYFATIPGRPSPSQKIEINTLELKTYKTEVTALEPFEISSDGIRWEHKTTLEGTQQVLYIRLGTVSEEGVYDEEILLTTPDADDIVLNVSGEVDGKKAFFENFESGTKNGYAAGTVQCTATSWKMDNALIGIDSGDKKNNEKGVRMKGGGSIEMDVDKEGGAGELSFWAGLYGTDTGVRFSVLYSVDNGTNWVSLATETALVKDEWKKYSYLLNVKDRIKIRVLALGATSKRMNVDDITISDYDGGVGINALSLSSCRISVRPGKLFVSTEVETDFSVYSMQGAIVRKELAVPGNNSYSLPSGAYILKIDSKSFVICL